jgi:Ni,Fe-hydrogenase I cytochrome b subunit
MTRDATLMSGIILLTVPTIQYGGYFLLTSLMNKSSGYMENPLRQNFFRAGHAHAGVIVILPLICQVLADSAMMSNSVTWMVRVGVPLAAILMPLGFFLSMASPRATQANGIVALIYVGAIVLAISVVTLGIWFGAGSIGRRGLDRLRTGCRYGPTKIPSVRLASAKDERT